MPRACEKCGNEEDYNFVLNIGLCNPCIGKWLEQLDELQAENKKLKRKETGVLFQVQKKLQEITGEQNVWKAIEHLQAELKELKTWQGYEKWATTDAENKILKTALQNISRLEDKMIDIGCGYDVQVDIMAKTALNQCHNEGNDSSTGHTESSETE